MQIMVLNNTGFSQGRGKKDLLQNYFYFLLVCVSTGLSNRASERFQSIARIDVKEGYFCDKSQQENQKKQTIETKTVVLFK